MITNRDSTPHNVSVVGSRMKEWCSAMWNVISHFQALAHLSHHSHTSTTLYYVGIYNKYCLFIYSSKLYKKKI